MVLCWIGMLEIILVGKWRIILVELSGIYMIIRRGIIILLIVVVKAAMLEYCLCAQRMMHLGLALPMALHQSIKIYETIL